jgi:ribonuclease M5
MAERIKLDRPVIVEGRYDKIKLASIIDTEIITTDGFGVFRKNEKTALVRRIAEKHGVFVLTDSDGAGRVIRNYFNSILPPDKVTHLYTPEISGKESRKKTPSKAGYLGVEGMEAGLLRKLFEPFAVNADLPCQKRTGRTITKTDMYEAGLSGKPDSSALREELALLLGLPHDITANALLAAINLLGESDRFDEFAASKRTDRDEKKEGE